MVITFFLSPLGGDVEKIAHFHAGKYVNMAPFFASPLGGDVERIVHFHRRKYVHMVFFATSFGDDVEKIVHFQRGEKRSQGCILMAFVVFEEN